MTRLLLLAFIVAATAALRLQLGVLQRLLRRDFAENIRCGDAPRLAAGAVAAAAATLVVVHAAGAAAARGEGVRGVDGLQALVGEHAVLAAVTTHLHDQH